MNIYLPDFIHTPIFHPTQNYGHKNNLQASGQQSFLGISISESQLFSATV